MKVKIQNANFMRRRSMAAGINLNVPTLALALLAFAPPTQAGEGGQFQRAPELPSPACDSVNVPSGNRLSFHVYALGVQIYRWSGSEWIFVGPDAALYADPCYNGQVGVHYAGPTWEANDGSKVMASSVANCSPFRGAIPWLRLGATSNQGHGRFARVTYIQRVNTIGGTAPAQAGAVIGEEAHVPYTAEYYFYRSTNP